MKIKWAELPCIEIGQSRGKKQIWGGDDELVLDKLSVECYETPNKDVNR